jgi:hypothetical protein
VYLEGTRELDHDAERLGDGGHAALCGRVFHVFGQLQQTQALAQRLERRFDAGCGKRVRRPLDLHQHAHRTSHRLCHIEQPRRGVDGLQCLEASRQLLSGSVRQRRDRHLSASSLRCCATAALHGAYSHPALIADLHLPVQGYGSRGDGEEHRLVPVPLLPRFR